MESGLLLAPRDRDAGDRCVAVVRLSRLADSRAWAALEGPNRLHTVGMHFCHANAKTPAFRAGVLGLGSLTITYFHTGIRTIIGVESFHGPVRDGMGWDRLAMVIRQRGLPRCFATRPILEEAVILVVCITHENPTCRLDPAQCLRTAPIYKADLL